jgi:hypothetical protein
METSAPTSEATTEMTEPEVLAAIASGEGQPRGYQFDSTPATDLRPLALFGAAALFGLLVGLGWTRGRRRG